VICNVCGCCTRCNRFVGHPCCGYRWHSCSPTYWNGFQWVTPYWNVSANTHAHHHAHTVVAAPHHHHHHHHHHVHNTVRHDAGSAIQALAGRK